VVCLRVVDAEIGRDGQVSWLFYDGHVEGLLALRRPDAVGAGSKDDGGLPVRFAQGIPVCNRVYFTHRRVELNARLECRQKPIRKGRPPFGPVGAVLGVDESLAELPLTVDAAPPEQRALARSSRSLRYGGAGALLLLLARHRRPILGGSGAHGEKQEQQGRSHYGSCRMNFEAA